MLSSVDVEEEMSNEREDEAVKVLKQCIAEEPSTTFGNFYRRFHAFSFCTSKPKWDRIFIKVWLKARRELAHEKEHIELGTCKKAISNVIESYLRNSPYKRLPYYEKELLIVDKLGKEYGCSRAETYKDAILDDYVHKICLEAGHGLENIEIQQLIEKIFLNTMPTMEVEVFMLKWFCPCFSISVEEFDKLLNPVRGLFK